MGFLLQRPPLLIDKKADSPRARASTSCWRGRSRCATGSGDRKGPRAAGSEGETIVPLDPATWRGRVPPGAVPMSSATGYGDREETHAAESEGEAARINLNGFGAEPVRRSRE